MNKASLNYILEFSVVEPGKREEYLNKLLQRKNAGEQKNVKLLKIIYRYIDTDKINYWDSDEVCKELNVKSGELDTLKSRLLADFRVFVFGWEEIEKDLKRDFKGSDLEFDFLKARKMNAIGMKKEMKTFHLNFLNQLEKDRKSIIESYNLNAAKLFLCEYESNEIMVHYYYVQKNYPQFLSFYKKIEQMYKNGKKFNLTQVEEAEMNVRLLLTRAYKHIFKLISDKNYISALNNLYAAYDIIKEADLEIYKYGIPLLIALIEFRLSNNEKLRKLCFEISNRADKDGRKSEWAMAKSYLALLEFNEDKSKRHETKEKIKEYYEICTEANPYGVYTFQMIKSYVHILSLSPENNSEGEKLMKHALANAVLSYNKSFVFLTYYQIENEKYFNKILRVETMNSAFPKFIQPEESLLDDFYKVLNNILLTMNENVSPNIISNIYITFLYIFFLKEGDLDLKHIEFIKEKLQRLVKTRNIAVDFALYDTVKMAFVLQEDFAIMRKSDFLKKHLFDIKKLCDRIIESKKDSLYSILPPYAVLYTLAKRINVNEVWDLLKKYNWKD